MGLIKVLPDTLISQIAAGEVIERPASAVKELIENSIDAGAANISIEIEQGGMKLISVRDDGCGMDAGDASAAFERHATSKIGALEDLETINSYGFRGEALAAIASVASVTLKTRQKGADAGTEIIIKGGKFESKSAAGCPIGTEFIVQNLFFNTPARKKFLKTENTELSHIVAVASHAALANLNIGFELKHNGKLFFKIPQAAQAKERVSIILGKDFYEQIIPLSFVTPSIKIYGFIGMPGMEVSSKRHQYLFVNKRDVAEPLVSRAVSDAYGSRIPGRVYPVFLLNIELNPSEVDVNVHPRKLAVKFLESGRIYRDVFQAVSQSIDGFQNKIFGGDAAQRVAGSFAGGEFGANKSAGNSSSFQPSISDAIEFTKQFSAPSKNQLGIETSKFSGKILGQIANSYILIFEEEGIAIIDQHAAHERVLYEKFKAKAEKRAGSEGAAAKQKPNIQRLLVPYQFECSAQESVFLSQAIEHLQELGFEIEKWSGNTFVVNACPAMLKQENFPKIFREFTSEIIAEKPDKKILPEKILKTLACKAAVKFGMPLSPAEQEQLMIELSKTPNNSTCPHGRPTRVELTFEELERRFYRRK
ncbi:MAG: DNA mismatch repair endonuclease MutL [Candidatus Gracilibacteria bacterium]